MMMTYINLGTFPISVTETRCLLFIDDQLYEGSLVQSAGTKRSGNYKDVRTMPM